ncbi:short-chain dehydrogenase/reductase [Candidatus Solirubrobacter pratensis]|uniref:short-chain dehydrogenase/reductase n=1 Tax=Candidatus Solirubrobacter pratensis TaxID=1298857 RepID=UPI00041046C2|nr:short-chain dehydrogenase/reductase [Candidatus Solirubrobacter pratensis]
MAWELNGRTALITGAASGIGAALARALAARGMRLGLVDVDGDALARVAATLPGAVTEVADVRDRAALDTAVEDIVERLGRLDVAVANAGIATGGPARMVGPDAFEDTIDVNLLGVWRTARSAIPYVLEQRGYLLLVASAAAVVPAPGLAAYSASKAGVEGFGRALRAELLPHGVAVGVGYYLFLDTPMVREGERMAGFNRMKKGLPNPISRTWPLEPAIDATSRGIERRARRIAYPPFVHGLMALRGLLDNGVSDRITSRLVPGMEAAFTEEAQRVGPDAAARPPRR